MEDKSISNQKDKHCHNSYIVRALWDEDLHHAYKHFPATE